MEFKRIEYFFDSCKGIVEFDGNHFCAHDVFDAHGVLNIYSRPIACQGRLILLLMQL